MNLLIKNPDQIVTVNTSGQNSKSGKRMNDLDILTGHSIYIEDGWIKDILPNSSLSRINADEIIDAEGLLVLPGFVECHTHSAFAGNRSKEFLMRLLGKSYEIIAEEGGGIISTVNSVRRASHDELIRLLSPRIKKFISQGITTLEIKSGYGLSYYDEIKLLQVINYFKKNSQIDIIPTFLGAHTYPPEYKNDHSAYLKLITDELLPYISKNALADFTDVFCEKTAFSPEETDLIFKKAKELGFKLRLHTNQFHSIGGIEVALKHSAYSVDHLEIVDDNEIDKIANSELTAVLLPGVSFFLDYNYAPARKLIDRNATVALSTDFNPGSSHIADFHFIMSLAALKMKMSVEEIISATTINAAKAIGMNNLLGSIEIGKQADFALLKAKEISEIIYSIGNNLNVMTIKKGKIIYKREME
ncbi:imidazolonepropionase [Melioribacter sp. OK-6-Me]|uniref:imidazolonepropionase n=1 Tax=unclassified Melioribacter TaxID=2627329 RepID=UPI003EDB26CA